MPALSDPVPVLYALSLGLVAAVNPCGLPMLPGYLALFGSTRSSSVAARLAGGLLAGAGITVGFVAVFGTLGLVLEAGLQLVLGVLPWIMTAVGLAMAAAGVLTLAGRGPGLHLPVPRMRGARSFGAMALYGMAYGIGSLSCALPLFLAAVGGSFAGHGFIAGLASYLAYALGMGLFVTAAAIITTTAGAAALRRVRFLWRWLPVLSGLVLLLSGTYLAYYWLSNLLGATGSRLTGQVDRLQSSLTALIGDRPVITALVLGVVVLAPFAVVVRRALRAGPTSPRSLHTPAKGTAEHDQQPGEVR